LIDLLGKNDLVMRTIGTGCPTTTGKTFFNPTDNIQFFFLRPHG
jgi:hypothetical protein